MPSTQTWGLTAVERRSTTDHVLAELRAAIISGRIGPSEPLRETALARTLGTGRSAIREAIRHLVQEGLVEYRLNRGSYVRALTVQDSDDLYLAREAIEVCAVRQALERGEQLDLTCLEAALDRIREAARETPDDQPAGTELIAADLDFHREMVRLSGSPRLSRAHETLAAEAQMFMHHQPIYPPWDYAADHSVLLEAIAKHSPEAPDLVREHLRLSAKLIAGEITREAETHDAATEPVDITPRAGRATSGRAENGR
ncbi:MAG: GntR family transcriptional regulator [Solirubrobacterales bacterium]|nr:GntR family transcriptional regulator [Solirubrobacterales bacterium]MBV9800903.1 GntR family transcriptional regulator [Solirubrobacterales bacterium]